MSKAVSKGADDHFSSFRAAAHRAAGNPRQIWLRHTKRAGISEKTLRRAKFKLGVISRNRSYGHLGNHWAWELPATKEEQATTM